MNHLDDLSDLARLTVETKPLPTMRRLIAELIIWSVVGFASAATLAAIFLRILHG